MGSRVRSLEGLLDQGFVLFKFLVVGELITLAIAVVAVGTANRYVPDTVGESALTFGFLFASATAGLFMSLNKTNLRNDIAIGLNLITSALAAIAMCSLLINFTTWIPYCEHAAEFDLHHCSMATTVAMMTTSALATVLTLLHFIGSILITGNITEYATLIKDMKSEQLSANWRWIRTSCVAPK